MPDEITKSTRRALAVEPDSKGVGPDEFDREYQARGVAYIFKRRSRTAVHMRTRGRIGSISVPADSGTCSTSQTSQNGAEHTRTHPHARIDTLNSYTLTH